MDITLETRPTDPPLSWSTFCAQTPAYSIALDGYVGDGPQFDSSGPRVNFNHHENVSRLETRATCGQVLMAVRQGLFKRFRDHRGPQAHVYVNDCDEDVCTAWFLLKHGYLAEQVLNPLLNRLVSMQDLLDATAGAYPFPADLPALRELAWVFEPYRRFRHSGELDRKQAASYSAVITDVELRIQKHLTGQGNAIALDTRYTRLGGGTGWALIREEGAQARTGVFDDGIYAYVAVRERPDNRWTYTIGRMSLFIDHFRVPTLLQALNEAEGLTQNVDRWGGGDTIGGSPRVQGSKLSPKDVERIVNEHLTHQATFTG
jgi:hypothetical protein